jgi:hypothetical protein
MIEAGGISLDNAREAADLKENNPVHLSQADYKDMANAITMDFGDLEAKYTNPPRPGW